MESWAAGVGGFVTVTQRVVKITKSKMSQPYYDSRQSILLGILIAVILALLAVIKCCKAGMCRRKVNMLIAKV